MKAKLVQLGFFSIKKPKLMKRAIHTLFFICICVSIYAQQTLVITEISYNPPESGTDSLEYIEIYNASEMAINMMDYSFGEGVDYTFGDFTLEADSYVVVAENSQAMMDLFGVVTFQWDGAMSNNGEDIELLDAGGNQVDYVDYMTMDNWPSFDEGTNGAGASVELCDVEKDNNDGHNWEASNTDTGVTIDGKSFLGTPGASNNVECDVSAPLPGLRITEIMYNPPGDSEVLEYIEIYNLADTAVSMQGIYLSGAVEMTFPNVFIEPNWFMVVAASSGDINSVFGNNPMNWDSGSLNDDEDVIYINAADDRLIDSVRYSSAWQDKANGEGHSLTLCNLQSANDNPDNWGVSGNLASNVGGVDIYGSPSGVNSCFVDENITTIAEATALDGDGVLVMNGETVTLQAVVHGPNFRPDGLQFTMIDNSNEGIGVFLGTNNTGYTLAVGDEVKITGPLSQFNGLAQIGVEAIDLISSGNTLVTPTAVTSLSEETESQLIILNGVSLTDDSQWNGENPGFNVDVSDGSNNYTIRIDSDTEMHSDPAPTGTFNVICIGGQFDQEAPFSDGYQAFPRFWSDFIPINAVDNLLDEGQINIYPNPVEAHLHISSDIEEIERIQILNLQGQVLIETNFNQQVPVSNLINGVYLCRFVKGQLETTIPFVKQ